MAFFTAIGVISNDIVRRETKNGVVTTFRLETGAPRGRKLWIDVECWGHLAGTIAHHGETGREVGVSGRLIEKVWRDRDSGTRRHRIAVGALAIDLLSDAHSQTHWPPNAVTLTGSLLSTPVTTPLTSGTELRTTIRTGRSGAKLGRLDLGIRVWTPTDFEASLLASARSLSASGTLTWDSETSALLLDCRSTAISLGGGSLEAPIFSDREQCPIVEA